MHLERERAHQDASGCDDRTHWLTRPGGTLRQSIILATGARTLSLGCWLSLCVSLLVFVCQPRSLPLQTSREDMATGNPSLTPQSKERAPSWGSRYSSQGRNQPCSSGHMPTTQLNTVVGGESVDNNCPGNPPARGQWEEYMQRMNAEECVCECTWACARTVCITG